MEMSGLQQNDHFIISKEFDLDDNEEMDLLTFYNTDTKQSYIFTLRSGKFYICLKQNMFGSAFYDNYVYESPSMFIIQEIDPLLLLINIIHISSKSTRGAYESLSPHLFVSKYEEIIHSTAEIEHIEDGVINETMRIVNLVCENNYEPISDKVFVDVDNVPYYKLNLAKVMKYLNVKLPVGADENGMKAAASVLTQLLPEQIAREFLNFKIKKVHHPVETIKRKKSIDHDEDNKPQKKTKITKPVAKKPVPEVSKDQKSMLSFFPKK